jgi:hypothetical protein
MNTTLLNLCPVVPGQSGASASLSGKNAKNNEGTSAAMAPGNNNDLTSSMAPRKQSQNFDQTLRKKIESESPQKQPADTTCEVPEAGIPEAATVMAVSLAPLPIAVPVATEDACLLEVSATTVAAVCPRQPSTTPSAGADIIGTEPSVAGQPIPIAADPEHIAPVGTSATVTIPPTPPSTHEILQKPTAKTVPAAGHGPGATRVHEPNRDIPSEPIHPPVQASNFEQLDGGAAEKQVYQPRLDTFKAPPVLSPTEEPSESARAGHRDQPALTSIEGPVVTEKTERPVVPEISAREFSAKSPMPSLPVSQISPAAPHGEMPPPLAPIGDFAAESLPQPPQPRPLRGSESLPADTFAAGILSKNAPINTENPVDAFFAAKFNLPQEPFGTGQTATRKNPLASDSLKIPSEEPFGASTSTVSPLQEPSSPSTVGAKGIGESQPELHLGRQIQETIHSSYRPGTQQIIIRLDPPELGKVLIKFIERPDGITGLLHVDKPSTHHEIQQSLSGLLQSLQNADVPIRKLEVVLTPQPDFNSPQDPSSGHQNHFGQHHASTPDTGGPSSSYPDWLDGQINPVGMGQSHAILTEKSINLLI